MDLSEPSTVLDHSTDYGLAVERAHSRQMRFGKALKQRDELLAEHGRALQQAVTDGDDTKLDGVLKIHVCVPASATRTAVRGNSPSPLPCAPKVRSKATKIALQGQHKNYSRKGTGKKAVVVSPPAALTDEERRLRKQKEKEEAEMTQWVEYSERLARDLDRKRQRLTNAAQLFNTIHRTDEFRTEHLPKRH